MQSAYLLPFVASLACPSDDFGRTRSTFYHEDMHKWIGAEATASLAVSPHIQLTDLERFAA